MLLSFCPASPCRLRRDVKVLTISTPHNIVGRRNKRFTNDQTAFFEICRTVVIQASSSSLRRRPRCRRECSTRSYTLGNSRSGGIELANSSQGCSFVGGDVACVAICQEVKCYNSRSGIPIGLTLALTF